MLTSKERAELRAQANGLETTLIVGKGGVTEQVVLEASFLTAREALDALCAATGAEPVCAVGFRFVLYRESERLKRERNQVGRAKLAPVPVAKSNPVRKGARARRKAAQAERERRNAYFRQTAIDRAIEREKEKAMGRQEKP